MDFNLKNYQIFKSKKYFKNNDFFLLFHSAKLNLTKWTNTEQNLKKLKLNYYKPLNGTTFKTFKTSIYQNFSSVVGGFIIFINTNYKTTELDLSSIIKSMNPFFVLISVKLNNKIYSPAQLKGMKNLSYSKNMFNFHKSLDKHLKTSYMLTNNKNISK
jgi:hypothetical protein